MEKIRVRKGNTMIRSVGADGDPKAEKHTQYELVQWDDATGQSRIVRRFNSLDEVSEDTVAQKYRRELRTAREMTQVHIERRKVKRARDEAKRTKKPIRRKR